MSRVFRARTRRVGLVCAAVATLVAVLPAGPAGAVTTVSVTPDTGLGATQRVAIAVSGAAANATAGAAQCRAGGNALGSGCAGITPSTTTSDGAGHFTLSMVVTRFISIDRTSGGLGTIVDCAAAPGTCT